MMHRPLAALTIFLAVLAAFAAVTLAVTTLLGVTFQGAEDVQQGDNSQQAVGPPLVENPLVTDNRNQLAICVQAVDVESSVEAVAKSRIQAALAEIARYTSWEIFGMAEALAFPIVDIGCPSAPQPDHIVSEASHYRVFVFLLSPYQRDAYLRDSAGWELPQELLCEGDSCLEVTTGLYLSVDDLDDAPFLASLVHDAIGLEPPRIHTVGRGRGPGPGVRICVEAIDIDAEGQPLRGDAAIEKAAKSAIEAALTDLESTHPDWDGAGYAGIPPVVDIGCPSPPLGVLGGPSWTIGRPSGGTPVPHVDQPSAYRLFVFVMPSLRDIEGAIGYSSGGRAVAQEFVQMNLYGGGPTLVHLTYGAYLTAEEIQAGGPILYRALVEGLGLLWR